MLKSANRAFYLNLLSVVIIFFLGLLVYSNTFGCPFNFDDFPSIVDNPNIKNIHDLSAIWACLPRRFILYYSFALNYHFNGFNVFGYHLVNLSIHLASAFLVWWFTLLIFSTPMIKNEKMVKHAKLIALFTALIFVAHPIQTGAVTYIVQRAASMSTMFYLASLCFYIQSRLQNSGYYYILSLFAAIAAMFTKETAITLPVMILLIEISFFETRFLFDARRVAPFFLTLFIIPIIIHFTENGSMNLQQMPIKTGISTMHYFLTELRVIVTYIRLVFLPIHQNLDYDYPHYTSILEWPVFTSVLAITMVLYAVKKLFSKYRLMSFGILWFLVTLLPESSFLPLQDVIFEHRLYLPMVGFSIFLVCSIYYLVAHDNSKMAIKVLILIIGAYSILTYQRNSIWRDDLTLWSDILQKSPHKARVWGNHGLLEYNQGNFTQALIDLNMAIKLNPYYSEAYNNRGLAQARLGNLTQAIADFNSALAINPKNQSALANRASLLNR